MLLGDFRPYCRRYRNIWRDLVYTDIYIYLLDWFFMNYGFYYFIGFFSATKSLFVASSAVAYTDTCSSTLFDPLTQYAVIEHTQ